MPNSHYAQQLLQLFDALRQERRGPGFARVGELQLSLSQMRLMNYLAPDRALAMKELAEYLQMTPPSVTVLTRQLVLTGLVQRQPHPEDNRVVLLSLTDEGKQLVQQLYQDKLQRMTRLLQGLSLDEQQMLVALFERAVEAMRTDRDDSRLPQED